jgi:DNA-binding CsgD family transcriptional regulator
MRGDERMPGLDLMAGVHGRNITLLDSTFQLREVSTGFAAQFRCAAGDLVGADFTRLFGHDAEMVLLGQCLSLQTNGDGVFSEQLVVRRQRSHHALRVVVRAAHGVLAASVHPFVEPRADFSLSAWNARILEWVAEGWTVEQIAAEIDVSPHDARYRIASLLELFGVTSRLSAVSKAYSWGVLDPSLWPPRAAAGLVDRSPQGGAVPSKAVSA